jgi:hypothetical protein
LRPSLISFVLSDPLKFMGGTCRPIFFIPSLFSPAEHPGEAIPHGSKSEPASDDQAGKYRQFPPDFARIVRMGEVMLYHAA